MASAEAAYGLIPSEGTGFLLQIATWKTDVRTDVNFSFEMTLKVFRNATRIAQEHVAITKQQERLGQLFASPRIRSVFDSYRGTGRIGENPRVSLTPPKTIQKTRSLNSSDGSCWDPPTSYHPAIE